MNKVEKLVETLLGNDQYQYLLNDARDAVAMLTSGSEGPEVTGPVAERLLGYERRDSGGTFIGNSGLKQWRVASVDPRVVVASFRSLTPEETRPLAQQLLQPREPNTEEITRPDPGTIFVVYATEGRFNGSCAVVAKNARLAKKCDWAHGKRVQLVQPLAEYLEDYQMTLKEFFEDNDLRGDGDEVELDWGT